MVERRNRGGAEIGKHTNAWFGPHKEREAYDALLFQISKTPAIDQDSHKTNDYEEQLRKLLLRRAMTDLKRAHQLQSEKEPLFKLMRSGTIGEGMWEEFKEAEHGLQLEIFDLQAEAETFRPGWGAEILKEAAGLIKRERDLQAMKEAIDAKQGHTTNPSPHHSSSSSAQSARQRPTHT